MTTEYFGGGESLCTLVLTEQDGVTTLHHTIRFSTVEERDGALKSGMTRGVGQSYDRLADQLSDPLRGAPTPPPAPPARSSLG